MGEVRGCEVFERNCRNIFIDWRREIDGIKLREEYFRGRFLVEYFRGRLLEEYFMGKLNYRDEVFFKYKLKCEYEGFIRKYFKDEFCFMDKLYFGEKVNCKDMLNFVDRCVFYELCNKEKFDMRYDI